MASDLTRRIGGMAAALLCCVSLAACNSAPSTTEQADSSTESTETATDSAATESKDATSILDATTESGPAHPIASYTLETADTKSTTSFTYDDAGNLLEQKTEGTAAGKTTTNTVTWTYDGNVPKTRDDSTDAQGGANSISTTFSAPEYQASGDGGSLSLESTGKQADTNADWTYSEVYDLTDDGKAITGYAVTSHVVVPESDETQGGDITNSQSYIFDDDGQLSELAVNLMGESGTMTFSYEGDTVKVSGGGIDQTWTVETDDEGNITKAVNEEAGATVTVTYTDVANPTDFNRAVAKTDGGRLLGDCIYGVMGSDLLSNLQDMNTSQTAPATGESAS